LSPKLAPDKRIHLTVLISSLTIGGAEQLLLELLKNMDRQRFDINLVFLRSPGLLGKEFLHLDLDVKSDIIRHRFDFKGVFKLSRVLAAQKTQVLFLINHLNSLFFGVLAARLANVPVCINWENETFKKYPFHKFTMLSRWILHLGIDKVVAAAHGHETYIAEVEKIPRHKIVTIYNGVDPLKFASPLSAMEAKQRLKVPDISPVVSIIAVLRPDKAHEVFLKAAQIVLNRISDVHFLVLGDGPRRDHLRDLSKSLGIEKNVHFLGFQRELADILAAVDINTLSSKPEQETLSVAAIEAMSCGIPIVCTDVGFMREIVIPDQTGYLVKVGDAHSLAERLTYLLTHRPLLERMRKETKKLVQEKLTIQQMTSDFENLIIRTHQQNINKLINPNEHAQRKERCF